MRGELLKRCSTPPTMSRDQPPFAWACANATCGGAAGRGVGAVTGKRVVSLRAQEVY